MIILSHTKCVLVVLWETWLQGRLPLSDHGMLESDLDLGGGIPYIIGPRSFVHSNVR